MELLEGRIPAPKVSGNTDTTRHGWQSQTPRVVTGSARPCPVEPELSHLCRSITQLIHSLQVELHHSLEAECMTLAPRIREHRVQLLGTLQSRKVELEGPGKELAEAFVDLLGGLELFARRLQALPVEMARLERRRIVKLLASWEDRAEISPHVPSIAASQRRESADEVVANVEVLTRQELAVLRLLAKGAGTREIADALTISPTTVKKHVSHLLEKLEVKDRLTAVLRGQELGLVP